MIILYPIIFGIFFLWTMKKDFLLLRPISILYFVGSCCAVYLYFFVNAKQISLLSVFYQCFVIFLFVFPIVAYCRNEKRYVLLIRYDWRFNIVAYFFIIGGIIAIIHFLPYSVRALSGNVGENRILQITGSRFNDSQGTLINKFSATVAMCYPLMLLLFFYFSCFLRKRYIFKILLLIASTSYVFMIFATVGRDGVVFWCFSYIFSFFLFYKYMDKRKKRILLFPFFAFLLSGGLLFLLISMSRFSASSGGTILAIVSYIGQVFNNFGEYFINVDSFQHGGNCFPLFFKSDFSGYSPVERAAIFHSKYGFYSNVFKGFSGSLYSDFGFIGTILISILYCKILSKFFKKSMIGISEFILLTLVYQIVFHNYFYFQLSQSAGNLYLILVVLFYIFFSEQARIFFRIDPELSIENYEKKTNYDVRT